MSIKIFKRLMGASKKHKFDIFDDDVFLVSYPKSGNTWLRFLIGNYISGNRCDFTNSHQIIPDIEYNPSDINGLNRPRIIKSHKQYPQDYPKVIYLVRDGRDVAVSYYYHLKKYNAIDQGMRFDEYVPKFIKGELDDYGSWGEHVSGWCNGKVRELHIIRYEDLKDDAEEVLSGVIGFCHYPVDAARISSAVLSSSFSVMSELEKKQHHDIDLLSRSTESIRFVREGSVGRWRGYFTSDLNEMFLEEFSSVISELGYPEN